MKVTLVAAFSEDGTQQGEINAITVQLILEDSVRNSVTARTSVTDFNHIAASCTTVWERLETTPENAERREEILFSTGQAVSKLLAGDRQKQYESSNISEVRPRSVRFSGVHTSQSPISPYDLLSDKLSRAQQVNDLVYINIVCEEPELEELTWELLVMSVNGKEQHVGLLSNVRIIRNGIPTSSTSVVEDSTRCRILHIDMTHTLLERLGGNSYDDLAVENIPEALIATRVRNADVTWPDIQQALSKTNNYTVFHFSGHGGHHPRTNDPSLLVSKGRGSESAISYVGASDIIAAMKGNTDVAIPTVLAVLMCCDTGVSEGWKGFGAELVDEGLPIVISMQAPIQDIAANIFTNTLYEKLSGGVAIANAVTEARIDIASQNDPLHTLDWWIPVLHTRQAQFQFVSEEYERRVGPEVAISQSLEVAKEEMVDPEPVEPIARTVEKPSFHGRTRELAKLEATLNEVSVGGNGGRVLLIGGTAGVGKSVLAQYTLSMASDMGYKICRVGCEPFHEGMSFFPVREIVRQLSKGIQVGEYSATLYGSSSPQALMASVGESITVDPASRREALVATFANVVYGEFRSGNARPLLLFIDDLEYLDTGSADALICLISRIHEGPVLVLGAYRTDLTQSAEHPIRSVIRTARRQDNVLSIIDLHVFSVEDMPELTRAILGRECDLSPEFYNKLHRETEGNPLFIKEVLLQLQSVTSDLKDPPLRMIDGVWNFQGLYDQWTTPDSVEEIIGARIDRVEPFHRSQLEFAAVIGRQFAFEILCILIEAGEEELLESLEQFVSFDIIRELDERDDSFEFSHGKIREVLYGSISGLRRRRIHRQVASVLQELQGTTDEDWDGLIGEHLYQAASYGDAYPLLVSAARNARSIGSVSEASSLYEKAYAALCSIKDTKLEDRQVLSLELISLLVDTNETVRATQMLEGLLEEKLSLDVKGWALNYRADIELFHGNVQYAIEVYEECHKVAVESGSADLIGEVLCDLSELHNRQYERLIGTDENRAKGHEGKYVECVEDAFGLVDVVESNVLRARIFRNKAKMLRVSGELEEALTFYEMSNGAIDPRVARHRFLIPYAKALRISGRNEEALQVADRVLKWASQTGADRSAAIGWQYRGLFMMMASLTERDLLDAEAALNRALKLHLKTGDDQGLHETEIILGELCLRQERVDRARVHFEKATDLRSTASTELLEVVAAELSANGEIDRAEYIRSCSL